MVASKSCWGLAKLGTLTCEDSSRKGHVPSCNRATKQSSGLSAWLAQLATRTHSNVAAVALANKLARMAWAVLAKDEPYRPPMLVGAATA